MNRRDTLLPLAQWRAGQHVQFVRDGRRAIVESAMELDPGCWLVAVLVRPGYARWLVHSSELTRPQAGVLRGTVGARLPFTAAQVAKAELLIADEGLVPAGHENTFWVVSDDGERRYLTHPKGCTCPAGLHARRCYHSCAATLLASNEQRVRARQAGDQERWLRLARKHRSAARQQYRLAHRFPQNADAHRAMARAEMVLVRNHMKSAAERSWPDRAGMLRTAVFAARNPELAGVTF